MGKFKPITKVLGEKYLPQAERQKLEQQISQALSQSEQAGDLSWQNFGVDDLREVAKKGWDSQI